MSYFTRYLMNVLLQPAGTPLRRGDTLNDAQRATPAQMYSRKWLFGIDAALRSLDRRDYDMVKLDIFYVKFHGRLLRATIDANVFGASNFGYCSSRPWERGDETLKWRSP